MWTEDVDDLFYLLPRLPVKQCCDQFYFFPDSMENGWGGHPPPPGGQGVASLSQWPLSGGRGRGFAPGRGRGAWAVSSDQDRHVGQQNHVTGYSNNTSSDKNCFRCGGFGHLSHCCRVGNGGAIQGHSVDHGGRSSSTSKWGDVASTNGHVYNNSHNRHNGHRNRVSQDGCFKCGRDGHRARECSSFNNRVNAQKHNSKEENSSKIQSYELLEQKYEPEESLEENLFDHGVSSGINFSNYKSIPVHVTGDDVPDKIDKFVDANLDPLLLNNIVKSKYNCPTPIQEYAIPMILAGRDLMACAQTGSGKTAAFLVPIVQSLLQARDELSRGHVPTGSGGCVAPEVVIISPTRELTVQIKDEARKFCNGSPIRCLAAYGGTSVSHLAENLENGCNILVATPGRLIDFYNRGKLSFNRVKFVVLDEADRMLERGFYDDMITILQSEDMTMIGKRQTLLFSATYPAEIQKLGQKFLHNYLFLTVGVIGGACADVEQTFIRVSQFEKREKLLEILTTGKTLVFVENKKTADFIASYLCQTEHAATSIHGDRLQPEREKALKDFKTDRKPILVATAVAARGLDIR